MDHFWREIEGYFTFPDFYSWVAEQAVLLPDEWHGVEVGVYTGQSAAYLAVAIENAMMPGYHGPRRLDLVDVEMTKHRARENLARLEDRVRFVELDSVAASMLYEPQSLDFVFIDADHSYASVRRDIDAWLPKVKSGGIISGHDYCEWPRFGVIEAVTETFPRVEVWRGFKGMGDWQMQPRYWPVWMVRV